MLAASGGLSNLYQVVEIIVGLFALAGLFGALLRYGKRASTTSNEDALTKSNEVLIQQTKVYGERIEALERDAQERKVALDTEKARSADLERQLIELRKVISNVQAIQEVRTEIATMRSEIGTGIGALLEQIRVSHQGGL